MDVQKMPDRDNLLRNSLRKLFFLRRFLLFLISRIFFKFLKFISQRKEQEEKFAEALVESPWTASRSLRLPEERNNPEEDHLVFFLVISQP